MERVSLGQLALKGGGTTLNKPPIGLHVKIIAMVDLKPVGQHLECFFGINRFRIDENLTYMFQCLGSCWYSFCGTGT